MKFNELNKEQKIIVGLIALLIIVFGVMQTSISMKNIKIKNLNSQITTLESENDELKNSQIVIADNPINTSDKSYYTDSDEEIVTEVISNENKSYIDIKDRFIKAAGELNKELDENIKGKSIISIDVTNLDDLTDNQISKNIERLNSEKFNISIEKKKMGKGFFYRINLMI